jgi:hypothetical protein
MWVADMGEDLRAGDLLISSAIPGHAMKDDGTFSPAYIIGRVAESVDWDLVNETVGGDGTARKHKLVSVLLESFIIRDLPGIALDSNATISGIIKLHEFTVEADQDMMGYGFLNVGFIRGVGDLWSIDTEGRLKSREVAADKVTTKVITVKKTDDSQAIGKATIFAGSAAAVVENATVKADSEIFVTFKKDPGSTWWIDEMHDGMFIVRTKLPVAEDVAFSYLVISVLDETTPPAPEPDPNLSPPVTVTTEEGGDPEETAAEESMSEPVLEEPNVEVLSGPAPTP